MPAEGRNVQSHNVIAVHDTQRESHSIDVSCGTHTEHDTDIKNMETDRSDSNAGRIPHILFDIVTYSGSFRCAHS